MEKVITKIVSSGFVVLNKKGEVLLGKTDNRPPYNFTVFKGQQEEGETLIDTAIRELKEETGIDVASDDRLNKNISTNFIYMYRLSHKDVYLFSLEDSEGALDEFEFKCDSFYGESHLPEICGYKWVSISQLNDYIFPSQRGLVKFLQQKDKS